MGGATATVCLQNIVHQKITYSQKNGDITATYYTWKLVMDVSWGCNMIFTNRGNKTDKRSSSTLTWHSLDIFAVDGANGVNIVFEYLYSHPPKEPSIPSLSQIFICKCSSKASIFNSEIEISAVSVVVVFFLWGDCENCNRKAGLLIVAANFLKVRLTWSRCSEGSCF